MTKKQYSHKVKRLLTLYRVYRRGKREAILNEMLSNYQVEEASNRLEELELKLLKADDSTRRSPFTFAFFFSLTLFIFGILDFVIAINTSFAFPYFFIFEFLFLLISALYIFKTREKRIILDYALLLLMSLILMYDIIFKGIAIGEISKSTEALEIRTTYVFPGQLFIQYWEYQNDISTYVFQSYNFYFFAFFSFSFFAFTFTLIIYSIDQMRKREIKKYQMLENVKIDQVKEE